MSVPEEPYGDIPGPRYYGAYKSTNGNGDVNKIVWGVAAFAVICLVTINGIMWSKLWDMADSLARVETQMTMLLQRLPNQ